MSAEQPRHTGPTSPLRLLSASLAPRTKLQIDLGPTEAERLSNEERHPCGVLARQGVSRPSPTVQSRLQASRRSDSDMRTRLALAVSRATSVRTSQMYLELKLPSLQARFTHGPMDPWTHGIKVNPHIISPCSIGPSHRKGAIRDA